jgi:hypothetical protein
MSSQRGSLRPCRQCYGSGKCFHCSGGGFSMKEAGGWGEECRSCQGTGRCVLCGGRGEVAHPTDEVGFLPSKPAQLGR